MMTLRNVWPVLLIVCGLSMAAGTQAAKADKPAASEKSTKSVLSLNVSKVIHSCARKTAPELTKKALPFQQSIHTYAQKYRVDADLIRSVITIESCYKPKALSPKSAQGLMQLIPATAERFGVSDVYDTQQNIRGGTQYLGWLSKRFDGDLVKMLAAYNAGEGKVDRYDGIPPYRETRHYVHDVLVVYKKLKQHRQMLADAKAKKQQAEQERQRQIQQAAQQRQQQQQRQAQQKQQQLQQQQRLARLTPQQLRQHQAQQKQQQLRQQQLARQRQAQQQAQAAKTVAQPPANHTNHNRQYTQQIVIGQTSQPISRQPLPVLRKAGVKIIRNANPPVQKQSDAQQRVKKVYASPFKPGRAGWQANKQRAPHLYKQ